MKDDFVGYIMLFAIISIATLALCKLVLTEDLDSQGENSKMAISAKDPLSAKDLLEETTTAGNHTYIVIRGSSPETVVLVLNHFEVIHPEMTITSWQPVFIDGKIRGVAIDHQPRESELISN